MIVHLSSPLQPTYATSILNLDKQCLPTRLPEAIVSNLSMYGSTGSVLSQCYIYDVGKLGTHKQEEINFPPIIVKG